MLINKASIFSSDNESLTFENLSKNMLINAWSPFLLGNYFSEKVEYGKIVNLMDARISGYDFNHFGCSLSKKMLEILTKSMALKMAPKITNNHFSDHM